MLRLRALDGGWTPIHVTAHRVELDENTFAGMLSLRLPTEDELAAAEEEPPNATGSPQGAQEEEKDEATTQS